MLSIQSSVAFGHVGNSAAVFPLQRLGHEVWPVLTVHFSNHTGYGAWRGPLLDPADVRDVIRGIDERGALASVDAVLSGYQGDPAVGAVILDAVARVKELNPHAVYCCDPVMGDVGRGMFVRPGIPEFMRDTVVPQADVLTPNHFELDFLTGTTTSSMDEVLAAVDVVRDRGPRDVLVTSVLVEDTPPDSIDVVAVSDAGAWAVTTPLLPISPNGCGDVTAALYLAHLTSTGSPARALSLTTSSVFAVLEATLAAAPARSSWSPPRRPSPAARGVPGPAAPVTGLLPQILDLAGTFVFALTGALVAVRARLDLFGTLVLAGATGLGGGLVRDVLLGDVPPPGLVEWRFLAAAALAGVATFLWHPAVARWENIILTLDAAGLALFCVTGALKASDAGLDVVPAALLGMITAIGGGIARDVLANRVPVVLKGGWYATPALVGAAWAAVAHDLDLPDVAVLVPGMLACFTWRALALHLDWSPRPARGAAPD